MSDPPVTELGGAFDTADGRIEVVIAGEDTFEAMRDALGDPVWLLGATWPVLTGNDFKRGRFEDAFGVWLERQTTDEAVAVLRGAGASATPA